jgi:hypothetical protein
MRAAASQQKFRGHFGVTACGFRHPEFDYVAIFVDCIAVLIGLGVI